MRDLALLKVDDGLTLPYLNTISSSDSLQVGQEVVVLGFPHADTGRTVFIHRWASSIWAQILIGNHGVKSRYAVVNLQGRPGQSGSPVLDSLGKVTSVIVDGYAPAGGGGIIVSGIDPTTLRETTHAISAEYLKDMIA